MCGGACKKTGIFNIRGKSYIKFLNVELTNSGKEGWGVLIENNDNLASSHIELTGLEVHHTGYEAIQIRGNCNNIKITSCTAHHGKKYSGIDVYQWKNGRPHDVIITGCTVYNYQGEGGPGAGIASEQAG